MDQEKKERTEITIETTQLMVVRSRRQPILLWCEECSAEVQMLAPEDVAALVHTTPRIIYRKVESNELHFIETSEGELFICCQSLLQS